MGRGSTDYPSILVHFQTVVHINYDKAGIVRSIFLGLRLSEIARNGYGKDNDFVSATLNQYKELCLFQGQDSVYFDLETQDLVDMATGNLFNLVVSLNKLIKFLPIMPINIEELRQIYKHAKEALIRA